MSMIVFTVGQADSIDAIARYMQELQVSNALKPAVQQICLTFRAWYQQLTFWEKNFEQSSYDKARWYRWKGNEAAGNPNPGQPGGPGIGIDQVQELDGSISSPSSSIVRVTAFVGLSAIAIIGALGAHYTALELRGRS